MKADDLIRGVIELLRAKGQLALLPEVAEGLTRAALTEIDPNLAAVTAPVALTPIQKQVLARTLSRVFGRPVKLKFSIDSSLIGGLKISLAGRVVDLSLDKQLDDLNEAVLYD